MEKKFNFFLLILEKQWENEFRFIISTAFQKAPKIDIFSAIHTCTIVCTCSRCHSFNCKSSSRSYDAVVDVEHISLKEFGIGIDINENTFPYLSRLHIVPMISYNGILNCTHVVVVAMIVPIARKKGSIYPSSGMIAWSDEKFYLPSLWSGRIKNKVLFTLPLSYLWGGEFNLKKNLIHPFKRWQLFFLFHT